MARLRVGVDLMGGDVSPEELFSAVLHVAKEGLTPPATLVIFVLDELIDRLPPIPHGLPVELHSCDEFVTMEDHPLTTLRTKKHSSMFVGIDLLNQGLLNAFVTAGNTGSLIAKSKITIPLLPGVLRPALLATLPTDKGGVAVIDVGGNVTCKPEHLVQFAHMGVAYQRCMANLESPTVGILNIGVEASRGSAELQEAYRVLESQNPETINFKGNVEGRDVFRHAVDVLVTDGFTGNVLLKTSEGVSDFIFNHFHHKFYTGPLENIRKRFDYAEYPGAVLCGVDRLVIKCHGDASKLSMMNSIKGAIRLVERNLIEQLKSNLTLSF